MKATLEFDLNDPEQNQAHFRCIKSLDMASALFEIEVNLRQRIERRLINQAEETDEDTFEFLCAIFNEISDVIDEHDINIDELTN